MRSDGDTDAETTQETKRTNINTTNNGTDPAAPHSLYSIHNSISAPFKTISFIFMMNIEVSHE